MRPIERFSFSPPDAIKQAVKQRVGWAVLSELTLEKELSRKELAVIEVEGLALMRQCYRIHHKSRNFTPLCDAFIDFCTKFNKLSI